jgi:conjugative transfer signal peptidase TraF
MRRARLRNVVWIAVVSLPLLMTAGVRLNVMPSAPYGVYVLRSKPAVLERGMLVTARSSESVRLMRELHGWVASWIPVMKPIAALPGDQVCLTDGALQIAGGAQAASYGPVLTDSRGHALPTWVDARCRVVPEGSVFLASKAVQSLDSRYFGPVQLTDIRHLAVPVLTWGGHGQVR